MDDRRVAIPQAAGKAQDAPAPIQGRADRARPTLARRALLLLACIALGLALGFIGQSLTSESVWFLAVPICIAIGWFFVADPNECVKCEPPPRQEGRVLW